MEDTQFYEELLEKTIKKKLDLKQTLALRRKLAKKYKPRIFPSITQILLNAKQDDLPKLQHLVKKPSRTISGVAPIAIMTKPIKCPHGKCLPCPGGPNSCFGDVPQSYTGKEPATRRAIRNKYDPYLQIFNRLEQYMLLSHMPEKVELIVMGGTFPSFPVAYQDIFIGYSFKALNDFGKLFFRNNMFDFIKFKEFFELPTKNIDDQTRIKKIISKILKLKGNLKFKDEQIKNENARMRCVALCIETRPDYCRKKEINQMLKLGTTRVELGVQSLYNSVLKRIKRGHLVEDSIEASQLLRDSFLKIGYHIMLGLPSSTAEKDIIMFKNLFTDENFKPDALKIYPCMVLEGTQLYNEWKKGLYKPLMTSGAIKIIERGKRFIPKFCRVMRVQRDIPSYIIRAGVDRTNLRQYLKVKCNCIRCREPRGRKIDWGAVKILRYDYEASKGKEIFLSVEDTFNDILLGFCRLRIPYKPFRKEITSRSAGIRELHVYGKALSIGKKSENEIQHKGYGKALLLEAEQIAKKDFDVNKLLVISGIGVREYYKRSGYKKEGPYMAKKLS